METTLHSSAMGIAKPLPDADSWQIITGDKEFKDVQKYLESVGISHNGFQYNVVAVFGSQSTGKSTLLNKLFGTNFATMDTISRQQTTKGIWLSRAHNSNIIVMDVEGTDGRERGDDQDFERKSALFSIATSEVLVVNMWESQVGLYNGANMGLLKTVFEVNLQLFQKERSLLLFVIRDHIGVTPMDNLQQTIEADLGKIWISLIKPPGTEHTSISDYFDLEFVGLPHKLLMSDAFDQEVLKLRHRFISPDKEQLIFQQVYHKKIPADGFSTYAKGIWEAIEANKDLDLPSQQELLAQFRCDEIASAALAVFEQQIRTTEDGMKIGVVYSNLGSEMSLALSNTLAAFDLEASRYHNSVYTKKRSELLASLDARLIVLYKSQLSSLRKQCAAEYVASVVKEISNIKTYDFGEITNSRQTDALSAFQAEARSCCIEPMPWSFAEDEELLTQDLKVLTFQLRTEEIKKLHDRLYRELKQKFEESITNEFSTLDKLLWDRVLDTCVSTELNNITNVFSERLSAFDLSFPEQEESIKQLQRRAWKLLKARVSEETSESHLLLRLREHFEDSFKFTSEGIPVVWKAGDNIDGSYRSAREGTLSIIPLFSRIQRSNGETPELPSIDDEVSVNCPFNGHLLTFAGLRSRFHPKAQLGHEAG